MRRTGKPIYRLADNMSLLENFVEHPERFGAWILLNKVKSSKSKVPTNIDLLEFKIRMEAEIRKTSRKIERELRFGLPNGLKG